MEDKMAKEIWKVLKETLSEPTGPKDKESWWSDASVQEKVGVKV